MSYFEMTFLSGIFGDMFNWYFFVIIIKWVSKCFFKLDDVLNNKLFVPPHVYEVLLDQFIVCYVRIYYEIMFTHFYKPMSLAFSFRNLSYLDMQFTN